MKTKFSIDFNLVFKKNQKEIDDLGADDQVRILNYLKDLKQRTLLNTIDKAPLFSSDGHSKLRLLHELYFFTVKNYVEKIFLASLEPKIRQNIFMFAFGRLFSRVNDIGVQACTDFDFNIVFDDSIVSKKDKIMAPLLEMKEILWREFSIEAEVNPKFSVISFSELQSRFSGDGRKSLQYVLFYKSIEKNYFVFVENKRIRDFIDQHIAELNDLLVFEQFLGLFSSHRNSFFRIKRGEALEIIPDNDTRHQKVYNVIGSIPFRRKLKSGNLIVMSPIPEDWYFSMKYMVNRVYDYVCAMLAKGVSLSGIGLEDHDYLYIREANLIMLILQELKFNQLSTERFGVQHQLYDFSYISSKRIHFFSSIHPVQFQAALKRIIYELNVVPRVDDFDRIDALFKKKKYIHVLWVICTCVEYWVTRKVVKIMNCDAFKDLRAQKDYQDFLCDRW
ncbi:MAG: hypothetical protein JXR70_04190 [Spirochaetales bacterium]|nr:hypothetical protein [Spirochaetales bacterium]